MHNPHHLLPLLLLLLLHQTPNPVIAQPTQTPLQTFLSCLPSQVPHHLPQTPTYQTLLSKSFRTSLNTTNTNTTLKTPALQPPLIIILATSENHILQSMKCAKSANLGVCARSGGHSLVGKNICKGVMIDVGLINYVRVNDKEDDDGVVEIGGGVNMGELLWNVHKKGLWVAAGVCGGVGVGGYYFGGGHGPYEGRLGLACDALLEVRLVVYGGDVVVVRKGQGGWKERELFWGVCGGGGGQFGVVSGFKVRGVDSGVFDRGVVFRFRWELENVGELMRKWADYGEMEGDVWFRMEMGLDGGGVNGTESGMYGYGACYDVRGGVEECLGRLEKAEFFRVEGRSLVFIKEMKSALEVHAFFGSEGDWGRKAAEDLNKAFLGQRYVEAGNANGRIYQSTFLKKRGKLGDRAPPSEEFWQKYVDFCNDPGRESIPWVVCELNLFNNAIDIPQDNAFAHRDADIITHYIVGGGTEEDKLYVYNWMKNHFAPYTSGVYVNYPELELGDSYAQAYWGKNLWKLRLLKARLDPDVKMLNPQPIPPAPKLVYEMNRRWRDMFGWPGTKPFETQKGKYE